MEDDSDSYQSSEWEDGEIKSRSIWRQANIIRPIGGPDADTSHLALCQRRGKGDSQFDPKLYIRKLLTKKPVHGTKYIKRELEMLRSCDHRNILRFEDFSYSPRSWKEPFAKLYTEYCAKGDLEQFTVSGKRPNWQLSNGKGFQVFSQIAQALLYIHHGIELTWEGLPCMARIHTDQSSRGNLRNGEWETILHRDIKPGNIFIAQLDEHSIHVKLGDFGFARFDTNKTQTYVETGIWLAPEQRHSNPNSSGKRRTTFRSDIYSFGLTMRAVMSRPDARLYPPNHAIVVIDALIERCLREKDTERPTSVIIIDELKRLNILQGRDSMILDSAYHHLSPPIARVREPFWRHETLCPLCRRLLKAGGVEYVNDFDRVRIERYRRPGRNESMPAMPRSMNTSGLSDEQMRLVQSERANGWSKDMAIVCARAKFALRGDDEDGEEVASLVSRGMRFEQAVAQVRQRMLEDAQDDSEDGSEDEDSD